MSIHPVRLLAETEGMTGYEFRDWLKLRSEKEIIDLRNTGRILTDSVNNEIKRRKK